MCECVPCVGVCVCGAEYLRKQNHFDACDKFACTLADLLALSSRLPACAIGGTAAAAGARQITGEV